MSGRLLSLVSDLRFWLALLFVVRLPGAFYPPVEVHQGWRQATTLMTVKAMEEHGPDLLYPGTSVPGPDRPNIIASEWPVYNLLIWINGSLWGAGHEIGRLISLLSSLFGIWCFYLIVRRLLGRRVAFAAAIVLTVSVWFMFSRKVMPDVFACSLVLAGVESAWRFRMSGTWWWLVVSYALIAIGVLSKLPALALLVFGVPLLLDSGASALRKWTVGLTVVLACVPAAWWYFVWTPHLLELGAYQLYWPKSLDEGWRELTARPTDTLHRFAFTAFYSWIAFGCFIAGLVVLHRERRNTRLMLACSLFLLIGYMLKTGDCIPEHDYYLIPFVPVMAVIAGIGIHAMAARNWILVVLIGGVMIEGVANQQHDLRRPGELMYKLDLASSLDELVPSDEPVAFVSDLNPSDMYFADRKGWLVTPEDLARSKESERLLHAGCRFVVVNYRRPWLAVYNPGLPMVGETLYWRVYALQAASFNSEAPIDE